MGRKTPILLSILMLLVSSIVPSAAFWAEADAEQYWSYDELQALSMELEPEITANCGGDPMCREMYIPMNKSGAKYSALNRYRDRGLTITSVDFNNKTIKIAYDSGILSMGAATPSLVRDLYVVQFDQGYSDGGFATKIEADQETPRTRVLVAAQKAYLEPYTELEFSVPELSTDDQAGKRIDVFYRMSGSNATWMDLFNFSDCLNSENYNSNTECRVRYSTQDMSYAPVEVVAPLSTLMTTSPTSTDSSTEDSTTEDSTTETGLGSAQVTGAETESSSELAATTATQGTQSADSTNGEINETVVSPLAPETGQAGKHDSSTVEFPWWLGAIFGLGFATLVWLFRPSRKNAQKKS